MAKFWKDIVALCLGHFTVFKHLFKKPVTLEYPEKKAVLNEKFRGVHAQAIDENGNLKCTACGICQKVCPAFGTIEIEKAEDKNSSGRPYPKNYSIDLSKCIFCGNCVQYCPFSAILMTKVYELADEKKSSLKLDINTLKRNYIENIIDKKGEKN